jgi:hypothetical protein
VFSFIDSFLCARDTGEQVDVRVGFLLIPGAAPITMLTLYVGRQLQIEHVRT